MTYKIYSTKKYATHARLKADKFFNMRIKPGKLLYNCTPINCNEFLPKSVFGRIK